MRKTLSTGFASPKWALLGNAKDSIKKSTRTARRSNWRRREWLCIPNSLLFHNRIDRVGGDIFQHLHFASGPTDLHGSDFRGGAEAKMLTEVVLREITSAATNLAELTNARSKDCDARADRSAVTLGAGQLEQHAVIGVRGAIDQQCRRLAYIEDGYVHIAIIIDIPKSSAPAARHRNLRQPGANGDVFKRPVAHVAEQLHWLPILHSTGNRVNLRVHMPISDEEIQPAGGAEVNKSGSPLYIGKAGLASFRCPPLVGETLRTKIVIQVVRLIGEISNEDTQTPFVPIVSEVHAHRAQFLSVGT